MTETKAPTAVAGEINVQINAKSAPDFYLVAIEEEIGT